MTDVPRRLPFVEETVDIDPQCVLTRKPGPVTLADRQGVFAHSFKCSWCDLEFVIFSWRRDRHAVRKISCPECGRATPMLHWLTVLSTSLSFGEGAEIHDFVPIGDADLLDDSEAYPDDRLIPLE